MKTKLLIMLIMAVCVLTFGVVNAYAAVASAYSETSIQMGSTTTLVYNLSKNVSMAYGFSTSGTVADSYAICTSHSSGDRTIGSGSVDQKVYYIEAVKDQTRCFAQSSPSTSNFANQAGWSAL